MARPIDADALKDYLLSLTKPKQDSFRDWGALVTIRIDKLVEIIDNAPTTSTKVLQGDGRSNIKRYPNCQIRTSLGNCDAIGGFCTSVNASICDAFHKLVDVVQGEWIKTVDGNGWNDWYVLKCPFCGATIEDKNYRSWEYNYCPHCGNRVKGGKD